MTIAWSGCNDIVPGDVSFCDRCSCCVPGDRSLHYISYFSVSAYIAPERDLKYCESISVCPRAYL